MGAIEYDQERYESAIVYFQKTLEMVQQIGHKQGIANTYNNLGETCHKLGQNQKALEYYRLTLDATRDLGDKFGLALAYSNLARLHVTLAEAANSGSDHPTQKKHIEESVNYGNLALSTAQEIGSHRMIAEASAILRQAFNASGKYRQALEHAERYIETNELIFSEEKTRALTEMQEKYESLEKEKQIDKLVYDNEIAENKIKQKKNQLVFIALGLALVLLVLIFLYSRYRLKQKINTILKNKNDELQVLNATKDKFVSILAHDLKNPFSAFCNITSSLHRNFDQIDRSEQQYYIEELSRSSEYMNSMLKNMLEWATIQMKPAFPANEICIIHSAVQELISTLGAFARSREIMLTNQVPESYRAKANRGALSTILNNLVTNAIKFSPPGNEVIIRATSLSKKVKIDVIDSGIGMTPAEIEKLFRIEVDTRSIGRSEGKGTGLGLIICKELVEKMGGEIGAESSPGKGTTFTVLLKAPD